VELLARREPFHLASLHNTSRKLVNGVTRTARETSKHRTRTAVVQVTLQSPQHSESTTNLVHSADKKRPSVLF
jgi:hypothetical protein